MSDLTDAIEAEIKKGEALCEKATPGPWEDNGIGDGYDEPYIQLAHARLVISGDNAPGQWDDWEFVQKTRTAYPAALALLKRAKGKIEEARGHLGAALNQQAPTDDQIIMDHMRRAHQILDEAIARHQAREGK